MSLDFFHEIFSNSNLESILNGIDWFFKHTTFWSVPVINLPISILFSLLAAIYLTFKIDFAQIKLFCHALDVVKDKYTNKNDIGTFTPKQAIYATALSTVGLGSVGGVAVAISFSGPGCVLWILFFSTVLSALKFSEITLGMLSRQVDKEKGTVTGGPFRYIEYVFKQIKMPRFGICVSKTYAFVMILCAFVTTNMFQCGQTALIMTENFPILENYRILLGAIGAIIIGATVLGGVKAIAKIGSAIVPFMTVTYIISTCIILAVNYANLPHAFALIIKDAFDFKSVTGGFFSCLAYGVLRAIYTTESGSGTSAIAHSAVKTKEAVMQGCTAFIEFLPPTIVAVLTGLIIVVTDSHLTGGLGVVMTSNAFRSVADWFPMLLTMQVPFLALTTAIAWGMYGDKVWEYFFIKKDGKLLLPSWIFKIAYSCFTFWGFVATDQSIIVRTSDYLWITLVVPNVVTLLLASNIIKQDLDIYVTKLKQGLIKQV